MTVQRSRDVCEWLSKSWSPFGSPKYQVPYYTKDPKWVHNFDNHPCASRMCLSGRSPEFLEIGHFSLELF